MRVSLVTIASIILALTAVVGAAVTYKPNPNPLEAVQQGGQVPFSDLTGQISREAYIGGASIAGAPVQVRYMHMIAVEVNGTILIPAPGMWRDNYDHVYYRDEVIRLMLQADYIEARGHLYGTMIKLHGHTHNVLVAEEIIIRIDSQTIRLTHEDGWGGCDHMGPSHGGMAQGSYGHGDEWCSWEGGR